MLTASPSVSKRNSKSLIRKRWRLRSHVVQLISFRGRARRGRPGEAGNAPIHRRTGTKICENVSELRLEMHRTRSELVLAAESTGLRVAAAGTHPFSSWIDQVISPGERYQNIVEEMGQLARSLLIFGMHIHIAMPDKQTTIDMMNMVRYFLPHLLALSTSSPFWMGRQHRPEIFSHNRLPPLSAHGHPRSF